MEDTVSQTWSDKLSKVSNDPLLAGVNTPQSCEDSLKINELMELCTNLQNRVLNLKTTKTTQAVEIESLIRRGSIADIDSNEDIYLVNVHNDKDIFGVSDSDGDEVIVKDTEMLFDVADDLRCEEVFVPQQDKNEQRLVAEKAQQELEANIALIESCDDVQTKIKADHELAQRLQVEEQDELTDAEKEKLFIEFLDKMIKFFVAKRAKENRTRPLTRAQQRTIMCIYLKNIDGWKLKS
nr:hypothetical protein [Tanacetum cinerariifolium]